MAKDVRKTIEDMAYVGVGILVVGAQQLQMRARDAGTSVSAAVDDATTRIGSYAAPVQDKAAAIRAQADGIKDQADGLKRQASSLKDQALALGTDAYTRAGGVAVEARHTVGPMVDDVRRRAEPVIVQLQVAVPEQLQAVSEQFQAVPALVGDAVTAGRERVRSIIRNGG
ncbi:MAG: hypothetical protein JWL73_2648 [Actinomycetia bacterium]|nr:hypothetical protein [Actinomycetes bacterium]